MFINTHHQIIIIIIFITTIIIIPLPPPAPHDAYDDDDEVWSRIWTETEIIARQLVVAAPWAIVWEWSFHRLEQTLWGCHRGSPSEVEVLYRTLAGWCYAETAATTTPAQCPTPSPANCQLVGHCLLFGCPNCTRHNQHGYTDACTLVTQ